MSITKRITKSLGGNRLGSGSKMNVSMHNYNRSNHDLSYAWRSSMNVGTLVPFMKILGLNGDTFSIDLKPIARTIPTVGPLFGAYKLQLDVFQVPIRLYNGLLHNNMTKIGLDMSQVKLPYMKVPAIVYKPGTVRMDINDSQISTSSLLHYLGIKGVADFRGDWNDNNKKDIERIFQAVPLLGYWDIYKCYYANKQEDKGVFINRHVTTTYGMFTQVGRRGSDPTIVQFGERETTSPWQGITLTNNQACQEMGNSAGYLRIILNNTYEFDYANIIEDGGTQIKLALSNDGTNYFERSLDEIFTGVTETSGGRILCGQPRSTYNNVRMYGIIYTPLQDTSSEPNLEKFPLENLDNMRIIILKETGYHGVNVGIMDMPIPDCFQSDGLGNSMAKYEQQGLAIKTYQSDLLQNWLQTEWIDGENGINQITAIDTSSGTFSIDALNLANKVYNMLNRIAVSGGTYEDWQEAVYSTEANRRAETPIYKGGMACEIMFEEVVSTAASGDDPLGTLGGKGKLLGERGGHIEIKIDEPSYIIGIASITPRIDYSQGNDWDMTELRTMNDLHKPALDGIGFEDLLQERAAWWGTTMDENGVETKLAMGKTVAYANYMTAINQTHGDFAKATKCLWMTLNRQYEYDNDPNTMGGIKDLTTYIDPTKYNYTFADSSLDAQNFWIQIGCKVFARRVMSAKILPNL